MQFSRVFESKMSKIARGRDPASFEAFLEKLASDVDPDVARIAYLHSQDWVGIPNFPVAPEDTFEFYGYVREYRDDEFECLATDCGVDAEAFMEELNFTEKWRAYVPVRTIGDAIRLISAWKRSTVEVPFPSMGNGILRVTRVVVNVTRFLLFALPLGAWAMLGRWSWSVAAWLFVCVALLGGLAFGMLECWHARVRRRAWELSRDADRGYGFQARNTDS